MQVYKITNNINDKLYIGQTIRNLSDRWAVHKNYAKNDKYNTKIARAMRRHGIENFKIETIYICENMEEMNELEEFLIQELGTIENGYNIRYGGDNKKLNPETIEKLKKEKPKGFSEKMSERRKGEGNPMYGKKLSPETIAKRTESTRRNRNGVKRKMSPESIEKRTATRRLRGNYGKKK